MTPAPRWQDAGVNSLDPYGDWASNDGADFLLDFKRDLTRIRQEAREPNFWATIRTQPSGRSDDETEIPFDYIRMGFIERALRLSVGPPPIDDLKPDDPAVFTVPVALRRDALHEAQTPPAAPDAPPAGPAPRRFADVADVDLDDADVIMIVVDHAPNPAHEAFLAPDGSRTRVLWHWAQEGQARAGQQTPFGRALSGAEIDAARRAAPDPETAMRRLGLIDVARDQQPVGLARTTHGAAVAALAAGRLGAAGPPHAATGAERAWLMTVGLPSFGNWDHSGAGLTVFVSYALHHALLRALALIAAQNKPRVRVLVNLSYGISGGPHDGSGMMESHIDAVLRTYDERWRKVFHPSSGPGAALPDGVPATAPIALTLPAGNGLQSRAHARAAGGEAPGPVALAVDWHVPPADRTSSFVEVWLPGDAEAPAIEIAPPNAGQATTWRPQLVRDGPSVVARKLISADGRVLARLTFDRPFFSDAKARFVLALAPTDASAAAAPRDPAPAGVWRIRVAAGLKPRQEIAAWIQREDQTVGLAQRGRPSRFGGDASYRRFTPAGAWREMPGDEGGAIRRFGTLSGAATGRAPLVVGAFRGSDRRASPYSAAAALRPDPPGPPPERERRTPVAMLAADRAPTLPGAPTASNRSPGGVALAGTSAASALAARRLADAWTCADADPAALLRSLAEQGEAEIAQAPPLSPPLPGSPDARSTPPDERGGRGRILPSRSS
ncbi:hypothetical protein [Albimonas pacifica]|uniref:Subtilase family protein n=1 Tax=Albimonas pacifica TaxID=1114924 RepID=A0A1I3BDL2_9RHOB|nr:hypothetical protein [Albimonas pacifica]SFH60384.1 hypothetical protein SAMN05216258_10115 [Albimonas pacifica]